MSKTRPAVFFDRDGVLIYTHVRNAKPYAIQDPSELVILPDALQLIEKFKQAGFLIVVVTNQPDVGNGLVTQQTVEEINCLLLSKLPIDLVKVCYHNQRAGCNCRKPANGMLLSAAAELKIDLSNSIMIGDRSSDIQAGKSAGCFTILIECGYNEPLVTEPNLKVRSLAEILQQQQVIMERMKHECT